MVIPVDTGATRPFPEDSWGAFQGMDEEVPASGCGPWLTSQLLIMDLNGLEIDG